MRDFLTWWTLPVSSLFGWMAVIILIVPVSVFSVYLGRKFQRHWWELDKPYSERLANIRKTKT